MQYVMRKWMRIFDKATNGTGGFLKAQIKEEITRLKKLETEKRKVYHQDRRLEHKMAQEDAARVPAAMEIDIVGAIVENVENVNDESNMEILQEDEELVDLEFLEYMDFFDEE